MDLITVTPASGTTPASATVAAGTFSNIFGSIFNANETVDGYGKWAQFALFFVGGMAFQNKRLTGHYNPF